MAAVVDMFCGVGALSHGFYLENYDVVAGIDIDGTCEYAYEHNNKGAKFIRKSIEELTAPEISDLYPQDQTRILVGCAPCQPFSTYANKVENKRDDWKLVGTFAERILEVKPDVVSMENVLRLKSFDNGKVYSQFVERLSNDYEVTSFDVFCPDYGIPQTRQRLVLFASRFGKIELLEKTHTQDRYVTVEQAIGHLPRILAGETSPDDLIHRTSKLSEINLLRIRQSIPGGTWLDWDEDLRAECHKKDSGSSYPDVYGRMVWNQPAPTITTQSNIFGTGRFGHPEQDRALSLREMALLQTFPPNYVFVDPRKKEYSIKHVARHIGNAVPVTLARIIARSITRHLRAHNAI